MTEPLFSADDLEEVEAKPSTEEIASALSKLEERCKSAGLKYSKQEPPFIDEDDEVSFSIEFKAGRGTRDIHFWYYHQVLHFLTIPFEDYNFVDRLNGICSYKNNIIEASIRPVNRLAPRFAFSKFFSVDRNDLSKMANSIKLNLKSDIQGHVQAIEISKASDAFSALAYKSYNPQFTIKIFVDGLSQHDQALSLLEKYGNALLFQIDLLLDLPFIIETNPIRSILRRKKIHPPTLSDIQFPHSEYDSAPMSLYWYARSATGMPLLQYLAYYQVIEYYYPTYSQAEAHRKIKSVLKDPAFRYDKDSDIGRLLTSIQINRSGGFGDERAQLKATINECLSDEQLREYIISDEDRKSFFTSKSKSICNKKINLDSHIDLRGEISERIYEIRCKIVHTKIDSKSESFEQLLPFSKEADQLAHDIELISFIAKQILIAASSPIHPNG